MTMKAKQFISFLMASAMIASFAACSSDDENEDPIPTQPGNEQTPINPNPSEPGDQQTPVNPNPSEPGDEFTPIHSVTLTDTTVSAEGCTFDVIINCNVECVETTDNPDMITTSCTKGEGDVCILTVTVAPNATYEQVVGKIVVEFTDAEGNAIEDATAEITITQEGAEAPTFSVKGETTATTTYEEALLTFEWETNCTVGEPVISAEWITLDRQNATGARFVIAAFNLPCDSTRTATITIPYTSAYGEELSQELTINQTGKTTFEPSDVVGTYTMFMQGNGAISQKADYTFNADGTFTSASVTVSNETGEIMPDETTGLPMEPIIKEGTWTTTPLDGTEDEGVLFHISTGSTDDWHVTYNFQTMEMTWTFTIAMTMPDGTQHILGQINQVYTRVIE